MPEPLHEQQPMIFPDPLNQSLIVTYQELSALVNSSSNDARRAAVGRRILDLQEQRGNIQGTFWEEKKRPGRIIEVTDARYGNDPDRIMIHTRASPGKWIQSAGSIIKRSSLRHRFTPVASPIRTGDQSW